MLRRKLNLQLFGEGGGDSGSTTGADTTGNGLGVAEEEKSGGKPEVIYGKQNTESTTDSAEDDTDTSQKEKVAFEDLIKGEYKDDFQKKTQAIIDKRFKETKGLQETLKSHEGIMGMLAEKYGVDAADIESLQKAIEDDDSFYEEEAYEKGLTVKQLKEVKALQRENEAFKRAAEEQEARQHSQDIYNRWLGEWDGLTEKYGLQTTLQDEVANPDFARLLENGISMEAAYMAIHQDEIIPAAMVKTASAVREGMANSISSRQSRPSEGGISPSTSSQIFKSDPSTYSDEDMKEVRRRVMRGERISF